LLPPDLSEIARRFSTHDFRVEKSTVLWESRPIEDGRPNGMKVNAAIERFPTWFNSAAQGSKST
jgi:hypothetical protein